MKKITWQDKTIVGAVLAIALINPLVGQYIIQGILYIFDSLIIFSDYIAIVSMTCIVIALVTSKMERKSKYNAKLKSLKNKSTKTQAYIE